jgi:hypothetical protein
MCNDSHNMLNYKELLDDLDFHDSHIESILIEDADYFDRKLVVLIDYYNWEGNTEESEQWETKTLKIIINHCVHLQINAPNLMEDTFEIVDQEFDIKYNEFVDKAFDEKSKSYFVHLKSKELLNFLSLKFHTRNYSDSLFGEHAGFIWIAGFNVTHEWIDTKQTSKKHIAIN